MNYQHTTESQSDLQNKMATVEKMLDDHLDKNLPSIRSIARDMALSESTLKRNFKSVYGTSIYSFYLKKKMRQAEQLLTGNDVSVKQVAYMLGYEKPSNFIRIFKKHYAFSPGSFRKMQLTS